jgi:MoCo/4Fe-4S cofactor protein with predicted Tat translocation signal
MVFSMALKNDLKFDPSAGSAGGGVAAEQWQALDQYMGSPEFAAMMKDEFPEDANEWLDPVTRRRFLTIGGASIALAAAASTGCNPSLKPASAKKIVPYVKKPEAITPGVPLFFPTTLTLGGFGTGVIVKSHEGRPIKVEGNPSHPASLGATDLFTQATILGVYDPDRSKTCLYRNTVTSWDKVRASLTQAIDKQKAKKGAGLRIVTDASTSPTFAAQMAELKAMYPDSKWIQYESIGHENVHLGGRKAFGKYVNPVYKFDEADVLASFDSACLESLPGAVRYSRDAMGRRKVRLSHDKKKGDGVSTGKMSRIYSIETSTSNLAMVADHRIALKPSQIESLLREVAKEVGVVGVPAAGPLPAAAKAWIKPLADDLKKNKGRSLVVVGDYLPASAHAVGYAINAKLESIGKDKPLSFTEPVITGMTGPDADAIADGTTALKGLIDEINAGKVEMLLLLGNANPVYSAPADLNFAAALKKLQDAKAPVYHMGSHVDETATACDTHINQAHELESWGDARAYDGTASLMQPLIAPFTGGHTANEVISTLLGKPTNDELELVKATWLKYHGDKKITQPFDDWWHGVLERGVVAESAFPMMDVGEPKVTDIDTAAPKTVEGEIEIIFKPDPTIYDGRFANNGWLQELPKPVTLNTWDNALIVSPATAEKLKCGMSFNWFGGEAIYGYRGGEHGRIFADILEIKIGDRSVAAMLYILPGHADDVATIHLGYGRHPSGGKVLAGEDGKGLGFNGYAIRTNDTRHGVSVKPEAITKTGAKGILANVQGQHAMEGRRPARHGTKANVEAVMETEAFQHHEQHVFEFADNPNAAHPERHLMRAFLPGTPEEKIRLTEQFGAKPKNGEHRRFDHIKDAGYANNIHTHGDEAGHAHHDHDKRLVNLTLVADHENNKLYRRWAMAIDLNSCTGCSACAIACVAENNIPVLGKTEVSRGRIMHWIRIDRYFTVPEEKGGTEKVDSPSRWKSLAKNTSAVTVQTMPVPCQQCEKAPCEVVCPVAATAHSADGLNDMAYNRCVGTRYCANNCPYKVRRFNFVQYADYAVGSSLTLVNNPEVTVRTRGVMEKCTYCVQRIRAAEIEAEREIDSPNRRMVKTPTGIRPLIEDGEIKTACQAACPSGAIAFGDLNQDQYVPVVKKDGKYEAAGKHLPFSEVARWKLEPTHYGLLAELNTMPRTSYLAAIKNPNPALVAALAPAEGA